MTRHNGAVRFKSIDAMVSAERACVWTLGGVLTDEQFERLLEESETTLQPFLTDGGSIEFDMPSLIIKAQKSWGGEVGASGLATNGRAAASASRCQRSW